MKNGRRYRYYTSQAVIQHQEPAGIARIPAGELEGLVEERIRKFLILPEALMRVLGSDEAEDLQSQVQAKAKQWLKLDSCQFMQVIKDTLQRVVVGQGSVELRISGHRMLELATGAEHSGAEAESSDSIIRLRVEFK